MASNGTKVLIDNGLSYKQAALRLAAAGEDFGGLSAIFVTHEHSDHVRGLGVLARKTGAPVYLTEDCYDHLPPVVGKLPGYALFRAGESVPVGGLELQSFSTSHDAADPVSFVVSAGGLRLGVATDLGHVPQLVKQRLSGADALVLEANYCPDLLAQGPYPAALQQRIRSRHGHLSNYDMASLLETLRHQGLRHVVLAHLSEENNHPDLPRALAERALAGHGAQLTVAQQAAPSPMLDLDS